MSACIKPARASRAEKCAEANSLGLVAPATLHEFDWAGRAEKSVKASAAWAGRIDHRTRVYKVLYRTYHRIKIRVSRSCLVRCVIITPWTRGSTSIGNR